MIQFCGALQYLSEHINIVENRVKVKKLCPLDVKMRVGIGVYVGRTPLKVTWSSLSTMGVLGIYNDRTHATPKP